MAALDAKATTQASKLTGSHTLLEVVQTLSRCGLEEGEMVEVVRGLLHSGRLRLRGNFRQHPPQDFD